MADWQKYRPNRVEGAFSTNSTDWNLLGAPTPAGVITGYASYAALLAAGDALYPGNPSDFPMGINEMLVRTVASNGIDDGAAVKTRTNTLAVPTAVDDVLSPNGQTITYEDDCVKQLWVKKKTGTDIVIVSGYY